MKMVYTIVLLMVSLCASAVNAESPENRESLVTTKKLIFERGLYILHPGEHEVVRARGVNVYYSVELLEDRVGRAPDFTPTVLKVRYGVKTHICLQAKSVNYCGVIDDVKNL